MAEPCACRVEELHRRGACAHERLVQLYPVRGVNQQETETQSAATSVNRCSASRASECVQDVERRGPRRLCALQARPRSEYCS
jgi:hypothetical protein